MKFTGIAAAIAAALLCSAALADSEADFNREVPGYEKCMKKATANTDILDCISIARKHYDKLLNDNYKKAMKHCEVRREITGGSGVKLCKKKLKEAERAWIKYRDLMAEYVYQVNLGSIDQLNSAGFVAEETRKQALLLEVYDD